MITNIDNSDVQKKIADTSAENAGISEVVEALKSSDFEFQIYPEASGLEFGATNEIKGAPNRGLMKIFFPAGKKLVGIFYKKSAVIYSRDRFSYGGIQSTPDALKNADMPSWFNYLESGFHPEQRPGKLQRTLPYTLPDN